MGTNYPQTAPVNTWRERTQMRQIFTFTPHTQQELDPCCSCALLSVCLSTCLSVCMCVRVCFCLSICLSIYWSSDSIHPSIYMLKWDHGKGVALCSVYKCFVLQRLLVFRVQALTLISTSRCVIFFIIQTFSSVTPGDNSNILLRPRFRYCCIIIALSLFWP